MYRASIVTILVAFLIGGCGLCGEEVLQTQISPNGKTMASVVVRSCGATTSDVTQVRLNTTRRFFSNQRAVFVAGAIGQIVTCGFLLSSRGFAVPKSWIG